MYKKHKNRFWLVNVFPRPPSHTQVHEQSSFQTSLIVARFCFRGTQADEARE